MSKSYRKDILTVQNLRQPEGRQKTGCVIAEGYPEVSRAIDNDIAIEHLYICPELFKVENGRFDHCPVTEVPKDVFKEMAFGKRLKGILAVCRSPKFSFKDLTLPQFPLIIVVERVEKPGNLGTILRSCDGCGVDAVVYCDMKTDIYNQHVVRASIGAVFHVPCVLAPKEEAAQFLTSQNINIVVASSKAEKEHYDYDFNQATALIIGNEHDGVSPFWNERAQENLSIKMMGGGSSLNAAVSASILMFEARRQRDQIRDKTASLAT